MKKLYCLMICFLVQLVFLRAEEELPDYLSYMNDRQIASGESLFKSSVANTESLNAEPVRNLNCLVFAGSAVKGVAYLGGIRYFLENADSQEGFNNIIYLAGASSGAIISSVVSSLPRNRQWTKSEIEELMNDLAGKVGPDLIDPVVDPTTYRDLILDPDKHKGDILGAFTLLLASSNYGICKGDALRSMINNTISANLKKYFDQEKKEPTFKDIFDITGHKLAVFASSLCYKKTIVFSWYHTPDVKVADGVRASMAFPGVFQPLKITKGTKPDYLVDGGCQIDFPMDFFNNPGNKKWCVDVPEKDWPRPLGIISSLDPEYTPINSFKDYMVSLLAIMTDTTQATIDINRNSVIRCSTKGISPFEFDMNLETKRMLMDNCYRAVYEYFHPGKSN